MVALTNVNEGETAYRRSLTLALLVTAALVLFLGGGLQFGRSAQEFALRKTPPLLAASANPILLAAIAEARSELRSSNLAVEKALAERDGELARRDKAFAERKRDAAISNLDEALTIARAACKHERINLLQPPLAMLPPWPAGADLWSIDGRRFTRLSLDELWAWSPSGRGIVSGDLFRDACPFVCDDDYGFGKAAGCRFAAISAAQLPTSGVARVFAKLPAHYSSANSLSSGVKHVFVFGGGDAPLEGEHIRNVGSGNTLGIFSINVNRHVPANDRIHGIPLGVERTLSPRGKYPDMYLQQRTGWNLASKLCWAPVLAVDVAAGGFGDKPKLLYMNFQTITNPGAREPAQQYFSGKSWVTDHVNAGDAVDLELPNGGFKEAMLEEHLRALWAKHTNITQAPWFRSLCGSGPVLPRGLDPALVGPLSLPGYPLFLKAMASSPFILAPEGNGISTHRAWEVFYVGGFAVIKEASSMQDPQYRGLPAMLVKEWEEVTPVSLTCFATELFAKAAGLAVGGAGVPGAGLYDAHYAAAGSNAGWERTEAGIAASLDLLDPSGTISSACAAQISRYAAAHPLSHTGFLSLESLDYAWWDQLIERRTTQMSAKSVIYLPLHPRKLPLQSHTAGYTKAFVLIRSPSHVLPIFHPPIVANILSRKIPHQKRS